MAQIGVFSVIRPMEASYYRKSNILSPPHPSSSSLHSVSVALSRCHPNTPNPSSPPSPTISHEKHQPQLRAAEAFLNRMAHMRPFPPISDIDKALVTVTEAGKYITALSHFQNLQVLGIHLNWDTLNVAMNCYCHMNRVGFGFSLLGIVIKRGYTSNAVTFANLLNGLIIQDKTVEAVELLEKLVVKGEIEPNMAMYGSIVKGLCKIGNTGTVIKLVRVMEERGLKPDTMVYNKIIGRFCKDGMVDEAANFLLEMNREGIRPDVVTYNALIRGLGSLGKWKEFAGMLIEMLDRGISPDVHTFAVLVLALCKQGRTKEAEGLLEVMKERGMDPNAVTYTNLMEGYCLQGRMDEARKVFNAIVDRGFHLNTYCYNILIKGYCNAMKLDEAMHLFREMPRLGLKPNVVTVTSILRGLVQVA